MRLEELRWAALEQRIDADLAAGRHSELIGELEPVEHRAVYEPQQPRLRLLLRD